MSTAASEDILRWLDGAITRREKAVKKGLEPSNWLWRLAHDAKAILRRSAADRKLMELHGGRCHSCPAKGENGYLDEWTAFDYGDVCPVVQLLAEGYGWTGGDR